jgi:DNA repair protein SbcC/Rad50
MLIKSLKLQNIRSYNSVNIAFPKGSVLLSGDIGCGKSTMLLAIEFALFGIKAGELSGEALLRHGAKDGNVELCFDVDGKEIIVKRTLKRTKDAVKQESGFIIVDGVKTDGTAVELKARIYGIMGYPGSLLSKSKDLIYRYTVYTPQEQMKQILSEDRDTRLDTLRRVFGIDKYKRIRENALEYIKELKSRRKELEGKAYDLDEKKNRKAELETEQKAYQIKLDTLLPQLQKVREETSEKRAVIEDVKKRTMELSKVKSELAAVETRQKSMLEQRRRNLQDIGQLQQEIETAEKEAGSQGQNDAREIMTLEQAKKKISETEKNIEALEKSLREAMSKAAEFNALKRSSVDIKGKIARLDRCPMCEQNVSHEHKEAISSREDEKMASYAESLIIINKQEEEIKAQIQSAKSLLPGLRKAESAATLLSERQRRINEKKSRRDILQKEQDQLKKQIGEINIRHSELLKVVDDNKGIEEKWGLLEKEFSGLLENEKLLDIQRESVSVRIENCKKAVVQLEQEIVQKQKAKEEAAKIAGLQEWLSEGFINLTVVMEKHIMAQIYTEFNSLFMDWFGMLIDDGMTSVRLDDQFTPVIEQNGYETQLENLSGGEKTSVALAYRLALNKVLNDFISHIKTKDLIMLDEPTDGFSSEQLDKIRDVLELLHTKQAIIVSHEQKIESFVDKVIRITKHEHSSQAEA